MLHHSNSQQLSVPLPLSTKIFDRKLKELKNNHLYATKQQLYKTIQELDTPKKSNSPLRQSLSPKRSPHRYSKTLKSDFGRKFSMDQQKTFLNMDSKVVYPGPLPTPKRSPIKISYKPSPERAYKNWHADPVETENIQVSE